MKQWNFLFDDLVYQIKNEMFINENQKDNIIES